MSWHIFFTIAHIVGTVLGVGGATFAEIFSHQAAKAGGMDETRKSMMRTTYSVMRWGMILLVLSGFGFLLLLRFTGGEQYLYSQRLWVKLIITAVILINALLLQTRKVPLWLGSAISFTSWYAALIIGAWRGLPLDFWGLLLAYIAAIFVVAYFQKLIRKPAVSRAPAAGGGTKT